MKKLLGLVSLCVLMACNSAPKKDYDAQAMCHSMGFKAATPAYDDCVKGETQRKMLDAQRQEFERNQQNLRDRQMMRGGYY